MASCSSFIVMIIYHGLKSCISLYTTGLHAHTLPFHVHTSVRPSSICREEQEETCDSARVCVSLTKHPVLSIMHTYKCVFVGKRNSSIMREVFFTFTYMFVCFVIQVSVVSQRASRERASERAVPSLRIYKSRNPLYENVEQDACPQAQTCFKYRECKMCMALYLKYLCFTQRVI